MKYFYLLEKQKNTVITYYMLDGLSIYKFQQNVIYWINKIFKVMFPISFQLKTLQLIWEHLPLYFTLIWFSCALY